MWQSWRYGEQTEELSIRLAPIWLWLTPDRPRNNNSETGSKFSCRVTAQQERGGVCLSAAGFKGLDSSALKSQNRKTNFINLKCERSGIISRTFGRRFSSLSGAFCTQNFDREYHMKLVTGPLCNRNLFSFNFFYFFLIFSSDRAGVQPARRPGAGPGGHVCERRSGSRRRATLLPRLLLLRDPGRRRGRLGGRRHR